MKTTDRLLLTAVLFVGLVTRPAFGDSKLDPNVPPLIPPPPLAEPAPVTVVSPAPEEAPTPVPPPPPAEMSLPPAPQPAAPAKKKAAKPAPKKKVVKKAAPRIPEVSVPLKPGTATVTVKRVNLRGQPTIGSEVIGRLTNTEPVTVLEEIRRNNKRVDDPDVWARIALPAGTKTWVHGMYVDANKTVSAKKLNVRGGPGENYSIVGQLKKGDAISQLGEKEGWLEITPPADAYAYVAAAYLKQELPIVPVEFMPPAESATVAEGALIAPPSWETPGLPPEPEAPPAPEAGMAASPAMPAPHLPVILDPSIKRIVDREGVVRRTWSIQAPSDYRLVSPDTGESIVYLHTTSTNLDLSRYKGLHIIVTGEEGMDRRWKNVPVLAIRRIQVIE